MPTDPNYPGMDEASPSETPEAPYKPKDDQEDGETALLPKSFFEGQSLEPGQQYYVEVVRSYEDEVEVKYPHKVKEEGEPDADDAGSKIDAMGSDMGGGY
jgi:hypothetical protein